MNVTSEPPNTSNELGAIEKKTFCGICEATCGLIASVISDRVVSIKPDPDHPSSRGFVCSKGVEYPMHRLADGLLRTSELG